MKKKALGTTGFEIAPIVFGGNVLGWTTDETESFRVLDAFIDHGFDAIDTADVYSAWVDGNKGGESETVPWQMVCRTPRHARQGETIHQGRLRHGRSRRKGPIGKMDS